MTKLFSYIFLTLVSFNSAFADSIKFVNNCTFGTDKAASQLLGLYSIHNKHCKHYANPVFFVKTGKTKTLSKLPSNCNFKLWVKAAPYNLNLYDKKADEATVTFTGKEGQCQHSVKYY